MADPQDKSTAEAERDVADARADLKSSIKGLEESLNPSTMLNDAMAYLKGDGRKYATALRREAETNPVAVLLIGAGLVWLAVGSGRRALSASPDPLSSDRDPDFHRRNDRFQRSSVEGGPGSETAGAGLELEGSEIRADSASGGTVDRAPRDPIIASDIETKGDLQGTKTPLG